MLCHYINYKEYMVCIGNRKSKQAEMFFNERRDWYKPAQSDFLD
jgi:hypothetical protein